MKNYETELPQNYNLVKTIDAKNAKIGIILNLIALAVVVVCIVGAYFIIGVSFIELADMIFGGTYAIIRLLVFVVIMIAYVILHELVHGAAYKALTKQKLTFGVSLTCAFCGVPNVYVYRKTAIIAVLAPFVVFLPVFLVLCFVLPNPVEKFLSAFMLGMHFGGCSGDLWVAGLLLFKFRDKATLMNDTGPKQTFYVLQNENAEGEQQAENEYDAAQPEK